MRKRGISGVVVTIMLVLISILAVVIVWQVIRNTVESGAEQTESGLGSFFINLKIEEVKIIDDVKAEVKVKRDAGKGDVDNIKISVENDKGESFVYTGKGLNELDIETYRFDLNISNPTKIELYPVQDNKIGKISDSETNFENKYEDIIVYYKFDLNTNDYSGNENHGEPINMGESYSEGKIGNSLNFDGSDDYVDLGNNATLMPESVTASAWVNIPESSGGGMVVAPGNNPFGYNIFITSDGRARIGIDTIDNGVAAAYGTTDIRGSWHHIAIVYDSSNGSNALYVDGTFKASINGLSGVIEYNTNKNVRIGARDNDGWYFNGKIDEVRIYKRALTQKEIGILAG